MNAAEVVTLPDNASTTTLFTTNASASQSLSQKFKAFKMTYTFIRGTTYRSGEMMVVSNPSLFYDDEFIENILAETESLARTLTLLIPAAAVESETDSDQEIELDRGPA
jgi:hypothetical protein